MQENRGNRGKIDNGKEEMEGFVGQGADWGMVK
jgi:hypothetical protein